MTIRLSWFAAAAVLGGALAGNPAAAQELVFGSWTVPKEYQNVHVLPEVFKNIEKETNGAVKWKLIPGGQIADGKGTFAAVKDGLMQGGLGIVTYTPATIPSVFTIYSTVILGHNDVVAASAAALEVIYQRCPSCLDEFRKNNSVPLGGWTSSAYLLACTTPVKSPADLKGKRVRATAGNAELMRAAGGTPVNVTSGRGGRSPAARGPRLPARRRRLAQDLRLFRLRQVRRRPAARHYRPGDRLGAQSRHLEQVHSRSEEDPRQVCGVDERQAGDRQLPHL